MAPVSDPQAGDQAIWHGAEVVVAKCQGEASMIHAVDGESRPSWCRTGRASGFFISASQCRMLARWFAMRGALDQRKGSSI